MFNGDPHPGNYRFLPDGRIAFLDFGLVKRWTPGEWERLVPCLDAILDIDPDRLLGAMEDVDFLPPGHGLDAQAVFDYVSLPYRPYLTERFAFSREFVADTVAAHRRRARARTPRWWPGSTCPPASSSSTAWSGACPPCSASWRPRGRGAAILDEYRAGGPPCTPLGERGRRLAGSIDCRVQTSGSRRTARAGGVPRSMADPYKARAPFAPWDRRELPGLFDVEESARRVGNYKWAEMKLFEAFGGWVATVPELDVKMRLGTHCYKHAWHAELWHKRLPELREMNPDRLTKPANEAMVRFVEALTEPEAPELTIEKLVGVYRVFIPRFVAAYTFHLNATSEITDAPTIRSLKFILQDELDDWRDGEMMIQSLLETRTRSARATRTRPVWRLMVEAGGIAGPGSIGAGEPSDTAVSSGHGLTGPRKRSQLMRQFFPVEELARDERFNRITMRDRMADPRTAMIGRETGHGPPRTA